MNAQEERSRDWVSIRRPFAKAGLETMTARYIQQSFKPHAHDEYVIGIIEGKRPARPFLTGLACSTAGVRRSG
ncbi:hypothetical protein GOZ84_22150 [Agrobacterium vitis]|nr:hypothetical protein [Allorhizobium ampelinum]MVA53460.1 hypothetical protein [Agrobacterium vitis]NSZ55500.1 hypothetical protein [Agrobacterium vitis]NTA34751.1 hypothetical protein [Agrobacterium vitis]